MYTTHSRSFGPELFLDLIYLCMIKKFVELKKHHQLGFSLIIVSGMICMWRGIWGLLDLYLVSDMPGLSFALSLLVGIIIISTTHYTIEKIV